MKLSITFEQALERASVPLRRKIEYSVDLIRKAESLALKYSDKGFYLAFSGGKDSQALMHITQLAGVKFDSHFSPSSIDPPENLRFIKNHYPEVEFDKLNNNIYDEFKKRKCLPSMRIRWCCAVYKEIHGGGRVTLVGVRNSESFKRSQRKEVEVTNRKFAGDLDGFHEWSKVRIAKKRKKQSKDTQFDQFADHEEQMVTCVGGKDKIVVSPIIHWSDQDVWEFLNDVVQVPHCELYDQGWNRIGCILCPMANAKLVSRDEQRWPYVKERWIKAISELIQEATATTDIPEKGGKWVTFWNEENTARFLSPTDKARPYDLRVASENVYDWWTSKMPFDEWYVRRFQQQTINFEEDDT